MAQEQEQPETEGVAESSDTSAEVAPEGTNGDQLKAPLLEAESTSFQTEVGTTQGGSYQSLFGECDDALRGGRNGFVLVLLSRLNVPKMPRKWRLQFAGIARRARAYHLALRILTSHSDFDGEKSLVELERVEYALLLSKMGAKPQASRLLEVLAQSSVEVVRRAALFHLGINSISEWNYQAAAKAFRELEKYHQEPYQALLAQLNLAHCEVMIGEPTMALHRLDSISKAASENGWRRVMCNIAEIRTQAHVAREEWQLAESSLTEASRYTGASQGFEALQIKKWRAYLNARIGRDINGLLQVKQEALAQHAFETARHIDLLSLDIIFDAATFDRLLQGSRSSYFRAIVQARFPDRTPGETYTVGSTQSVLEMPTFEWEGRKLPKPAQRVYQTLMALTSDVYAPPTSLELFFALRAEDQEDAKESLDLCHQLVKRTRQWLKAQSLPIDIVSVDNRYQLRPALGFGVRVAPLPIDSDAKETMLARLIEKFEVGQEIQPKDVRRQLGLNESSTRRWLRWACESGYLDAQGRNKGRTYILKSRPS